MRRLISQDALIVLHNGLVQRYLMYGLVARGSANKTNIQSLQVLQNKIIRTISGVRRNEHVINNRGRWGYFRNGASSDPPTSGFIFAASCNL